MRTYQGKVPVQVLFSSSSRTVELDPDEKVIRTRKIDVLLPQYGGIYFEDLSIEVPYRTARAPSVWVVRVRKDLETDDGRPHRLAGAVLGKVSTERLYGIEAEAGVAFREKDGAWNLGRVEPYPKWREEERQAAKVEKKAAYRRRKYLRQPTVFELLMRDDWIDEIE